MLNKQNERKIGKTSLPETYNVAVESEEIAIINLEENALSVLLSKSKESTKEFKKASKPLAEDNAVKKALAEISFIEAGETLEKGDIQSAIAKYKEAISYISDNPSYYLKLVDIFAKDSKYKTELDALLKDLSKKFPNNDEVKSRITELAPTKQGVKHTTKISGNDKNTSLIGTNSLENSKEKETNKSTHLSKSHVKFDRKSDKKSDTKIDSKTDSTPKAAKMVRLRNNMYILTEGVKKQNPYAKAITILFLILMPIGVFWGLNESYKETIIETIPISPDSQSSLVESELYFCWASSTNKVDYLFQVEQEGKPVLERYTRENFYLVSKEDAKLIKKNIYSTWRAIPISPKRETLKYKTNEAQFIITNNR